MDERLAKVIVWLVISMFAVNQAPGVGQVRSVTITHKSKTKGDARARQAIKLATRLVAALPAILEQFRARRRELLAQGAGAAYPQAGIATLLDSTEISLQKEFKKSDFAPLRDHIAEVFDRARSEIGLPTRTALRTSPAPQAILASLSFAVLAQAPGSPLERSRADPALDVIVAFLEDLRDRATRKDLTVRLCVISDPPKANVSIHAAGSKEIDPRKTNGTIDNLFRGNYFVTLHRRSLPNVDCGSPAGCKINLYDKKQPRLDCEFASRDCVVADRWLKACDGS